MIEYTFKNAEEVIKVYGEPLTARRTSKIRIREVEGEIEIFKSLGGNELTAIKDIDWVMLPENHPPYPCKKDIFERSWEPILEEPGFYRRSALAKVIPIPEGCAVTLETLEGSVTVTYPSYIAIGVDGEVYSNSQEWVTNNLEFI